MFYFCKFYYKLYKKFKQITITENVLTKGDLKCQKTQNLLFTR